MEKLRFAPIIRVSTEGQKEKGESLNVQTEQIKQYVEILKGIIPEHCKQYSGQEHATPDQERAKLDQLLKDSSKDLFDAVIVVDTSRWSRDNLKNKEGLKILRENNIRFFIGMMEYDLHNPEHNFLIGMTTEINEFQAKIRNQKSILSRIAKAKKNQPATGRLPYGRTYDKKTDKWGIDKEKGKKIKQAARRYLKGESIVDISETLDMHFTVLWKVLTKRSGPEWVCRFRYEKIDESVIIKVPELLDKNTIAAIHEQARANKTYKHGEKKHHYLLSRMIFCDKCGYAMFGYINSTGKRYYRHANTKQRNIKCDHKKFLPANEIENVILLELTKTFGDPMRIKKAIKDATPDYSKIEELIKERTELSGKLKQTISQKEGVVDAVAEGLLSKVEIKRKMEKLRSKESSISKRLQIIETELQSVPDPAKIKRLSHFSGKVYSSMMRSDSKMIFNKSYAWKRNLIEHAFSGSDSQEKRLGVYMQETNDEKQPWKFEIRGALESTILGLPLSDEYLEEAFNLDSEYQDIEKELKRIRKQVSFSIT